MEEFLNVPTEESLSENNTSSSGDIDFLSLFEIQTDNSMPEKVQTFPQGTLPYSEDLADSYLMDLLLSDLPENEGSQMSRQNAVADQKTQQYYSDLINRHNLSEAIVQQMYICLSAAQRVQELSTLPEQSGTVTVTKKRKADQISKSGQKEEPKSKRTKPLEKFNTKKLVFQGLSNVLQDYENDMREILCKQLEISDEDLTEIIERVQAKQSLKEQKNELLLVMLTHPKLIQAAKWLHIYSHAKKGEVFDAFCTILDCINNDSIKDLFKMYQNNPEKPKVESLLIINIMMQMVCLQGYHYAIDSFNASELFGAEFSKKGSNTSMLLYPPYAKATESVVIVIQNSFSSQALASAQLFFGEKVVTHVTESNDFREKSNKYTRIRCTIPQGQGTVCVKFRVGNADVGVATYSYPTTVAP